MRIGLLKEVVEKLQRGENFDVEKALGTGDPEKEADWEAVLKEIERDDITRNQKKQEKTKPSDPPSIKKFTTVQENEPAQAPTKSRSGTASFF